MDELWLFLIASLVGISCSLVGCFLVLRRLAMMGDAISHTVLFGVVVGFILTSSWSTWLMVLFACLAGIFTTFATEFLTKHAGTPSDASIGVVFTWMFAVAIIILTLLAGDAHIDLDCVLFGELAFQTFDVIELGGREIGPRAFWQLVLVVLFEIILLVVGFRALKTSAFDKALAATLGISVMLWHYVLMTAVSVATVVNLEAVGAILVVAMLVVPANTAYLMAKSVEGMLVISCIISVLSAALGIFLSVIFNASPSAGIAIASGLILLIVLFVQNIKKTKNLASLAEPVLE